MSEETENDVKTISERRIFVYGFFLGVPAKEKKNFWIESLKRHVSDYFIFENCRGAYRVNVGKEENLEWFPSQFSEFPFSWDGFWNGKKIWKKLGGEGNELLKAVKEHERQMVASRVNQIRSRKRRFAKKWFWSLQFYTGLTGMDEILERHQIGGGDVFILWGQHPSVHRLLAERLRERGATVLFSEGSELQKSVFLSERGINNYGWPREFDDVFRNLEVDEKDLERGKAYIERLRTDRFSNKEYDENESDFFAKNKFRGKFLIYVNGLENFASGLRPRCSHVSREISPRFASNEELLLQVLELAEEHDWTVLYKDHPNTFKYEKNLLVKGIRHPRLIMADNLDIHEVMDHADAMVSMCSKVVLLALARGVPVVLGGPFTVRAKNLEYGLEEDDDLLDGLKKVLARKRGERVDEISLDLLVARFIRYYSYRMEGAEWDSNRGKEEVWTDLKSYLEGQRDVISASIRLKKTVSGD